MNNHEGSTMEPFPLYSQLPGLFLRKQYLSPPKKEDASS
jgi:hypothetical protein